MLNLRAIKHADGAARSRLDAVRREFKTDAQRQRFDRIVDILDTNGWALDSQGHLDSQLAALATRQVEQILTTVYEEEFDDLPGATGDVLPINSSIADGAKFFVYYIHTGGGLARFASDYSTEYPLAHIQQAEKAGTVQLIKGGYGFGEEDLVAARFAGQNIEPRLQGHARRAHMEVHHTTCLWGREDLGLPGLVNHPNIQILDAAADGTGSSQLWTAKTADQILRDVSSVLNAPRHISNDRERPNRLRMPLELFTYVSTTRIGVGDGKDMVLDLLKAAHPGIDFGVWQDLAASKSQGNLSTDSLFAYTFNANKASFVVPRPFKMGAPQQDLDQIVVPGTSKVGGVLMPFPLMCARMDGVGAN